MGLRQVACAPSELGLVWWRTFVTEVRAAAFVLFLFVQARARMVVPREPQGTACASLKLARYGGPCVLFLFGRHVHAW